MATTTGGTTYVTSTDLVADYPTASLAIANRVDVVASGGPALVKTGAYTITVANILSGARILYNSASAGTISLPTASLVDGMTVEIAQIGAGAVTVNGGTIVGTAVSSSQYQALRFVYVAAGATWYSIAEASPAGLTLVSAQSFSAQSTIAFNNVFTSTYDNYRVMVKILGSTTAVLTCRLRAGGTDSSASYANQEIAADGTAVSAAKGTSLSSWNNFLPYGTTPAAATVDFISPALAEYTQMFLTIQRSQNTVIILQETGIHAVSSAYDGFSVTVTGGTITGSIRVYGYKNS